MRSNYQRLWLYSCFAAVLLAGWAGGFGVIFMLVFITIYLVGVVLIGPDEPELHEQDEQPADEAANEAVPEAEPTPESELEPDPAVSAGDEA